MDYLARYDIRALEYSFGGWKRYDDNKEFRFNALDDKNALKLAEDHAKEIRSNLFGAIVTLNSLLMINRVDIKKLRD